MRLASNTDVPDAPSGFRAMHREATPRLCVFSNYTYTLETIIQAARKNLAIASVPSESTVSSDLTAGQEHSVVCATLDPDDPQDLHPLQAAAVLFGVGVLFLLPGIALGARFVWQYLLGRGAGHVQSLILAAIPIVISVVVFAAGILSDLMAANRVLLEEIHARQRQAGIDASFERGPCPTMEPNPVSSE